MKWAGARYGGREIVQFIIKSVCDVWWSFRNDSKNGARTSVVCVCVCVSSGSSLAALSSQRRRRFLN